MYAPVDVTAPPPTPAASSPPLGFEPEPRPFQLHVTLGRVRQGARVDPTEVARGAEQVRVGAEFVVSLPLVD